MPSTSECSTLAGPRSGPPPPPSSSPGPARQTELERTMTRDALSIVRAGIEAVDPRAAVLAHLSSSTTSDYGPALVVADPSKPTTHVYRASDYDEVLIVAFGKASSAMALAAAECVSNAFGTDAVTIRGIAIVKDDHATPHELDVLPRKYHVEIRQASHPVPDRRSVKAADEVLDLVGRSASKRTLVLCCVSGGGSALFCSPRAPLTLEDLASTNAALLASGMDIEGMNAVRKCLERGKGGRLAALAYPSTVVALVLSDIVGDPLSLIASGPTVPDDDSGWAEAAELVGRYGLGRGERYALPDAVLDSLEEGSREELEDADDAPKSSHPAFCTERKLSRMTTATSGGGGGGSSLPPSMLTETVLVGNNQMAVSAAAGEASRLGYNPVVLGTTIVGEARHVAGFYVAMAEHLHRQKRENATADGNDATPSSGSGSAAASAIPPLYPIAELPTALIGGGETTVTLPTDGGMCGKGGRNQELGLAAGLSLRSLGLRDVVLASVGTDGTDGPTDAAGAVVDGGTIDRIERSNGGTMAGKDALRNHDAYTFFDRCGDDHDDEEGDSGGASSPLVRTGPTGTNVADICVTLVR